MSSTGVASSKMTTASVEPSAARTRVPLRSPDHRPGGAFQSLNGSVAVHPDSDLVAKFAALFEQGNVTHVQDVKAAVGKDNAIAVGTPLRQTNQQTMQDRESYPDLSSGWTR